MISLDKLANYGVVGNVYAWFLRATCEITTKVNFDGCLFA